MAESEKEKLYFSLMFYHCLPFNHLDLNSI